MGHFAKIENGLVTNVIIAEQEFIDSKLVEGTWLETTFGAAGGIVYETPIDDGFTITSNGLPVGVSPIPTDKPCIRKNYGGIGYTYDSVLDAFIPPKPYLSWVLNESTCLWCAPIPMPNDGKTYVWDEETLNWKQT
jgi:hypothetical protein